MRLAEGFPERCSQSPRGGSAELNRRTNFHFEYRIRESHAGQLGLIGTFTGAGLIASE